MPTKLTNCANAAVAGVAPRYIPGLFSDRRINGAERVGRARIIRTLFNRTPLPTGPKSKEEP